MKYSHLFLALLAIVVAGPARSQPIEGVVGSGNQFANAVIQFSGGDSFRWIVLFDGTTTGLGMLQAIEAETPGFELTIEDFGLGPFVDGIAYAGNDDQGFGGGEDFWHYWLGLPLLETWIPSPEGAADRLVTDGDWDGWRYGSADPPQLPVDPPVDVPSLDGKGAVLMSLAMIVTGLVGLSFLGGRRR